MYNLLGFLGGGSGLFSLLLARFLTSLGLPGLYYPWKAWVKGLLLSLGTGTGHQEAQVRDRLTHSLRECGRPPGESVPVLMEVTFRWERHTPNNEMAASTNRCFKE